MVEFTGLQDVTSKDIYEGDIVDVDIPFKNNAIMIVKKYLSEMLLSFNLDEEDTDCMFRFKDVGELKIIGNIYENPELLEQGRGNFIFFYTFNFFFKIFLWFLF